MRTGLWIGLGIAVVIALVFVGLTTAWALWGRQLWAVGPLAAPETVVGMGLPEGCGGRGYGVRGGQTTILSSTLTIEEAHEAVERYVAALGYPNRSAERSRRSLEVAEVMEFERNFYAIVQEADTGIGAMELLVDRWTGAVGPEMGPNIMWNGRYGMHGRGGWMMGGASETNALSPEEALKIAQRWLDVYRSGVSVEEHADTFYGYYTIHTLKDGQIEGMLSVHGTTGQAWYHIWHGPFIHMIGEEKEEGH